MPVPSALSWSERHPNGPRLLGRELLEWVALEGLLDHDHQPKQAFGLLSHRLRIARALVAGHGRRVYADLRGEIGPGEPKVLPKETDLLREQPLALLCEREGDGLVQLRQRRDQCLALAALRAVPDLDVLERDVVQPARVVLVVLTPYFGRRTADAALLGLAHGVFLQAVTIVRVV